MINILLRETADDICTLGRWTINGVHECVTLEDPVRPYPNKIPKKTCIWGDRMYFLSIDYSPKFDRDMIHVQHVPLFTGIRVHSGKDAEWTEGCVLVGNHRQDHSISRDPEVEARLKEKIRIAIAAGESIMLFVVNPIKAMEPLTTIGE